MSEQLSRLMVRLTELADAQGDVPEDGSGIDGVWTTEIEDIDHDQQWFVAINADGDEREYCVVGDREIEIEPFHAHAWWDTDQIVPATIFSPYGSQQLRPPETFDRSVEDQLLLSIEAALAELDYEFEPTDVDDGRLVTDGGHISRTGRDDLYRQAREQWGTDAQLTKAAEEFAEVAAVISRMQNGQADRDDLLEELVDAQLMLEQMQLEYRDAEYQAALDEAIADLEDRLASSSSRMMTSSDGATTVGCGPDPEHFEWGDDNAE